MFARGPLFVNKHRKCPFARAWALHPWRKPLVFDYQIHFRRPVAPFPFCVVEGKRGSVAEGATAINDLLVSSLPWVSLSLRPCQTKTRELEDLLGKLRAEAREDLPPATQIQPFTPFPNTQSKS